MFVFEEPSVKTIFQVGDVMWKSGLILHQKARVKRDKQKDFACI